MPPTAWADRLAASGRSLSVHWTRTGLGWILIAVPILAAACVSAARADFTQTSEKLLITASSPTNWTDAPPNILLL